MSTNNSQQQFEIYKLHAELARDIDSNRESLNKIYAGMVISIIAASAFLHRSVTDVENVWILLVLGIIVALSWMFSLHSLTRKLRAKHDVLLTLEKELSFNFFEQENIKFNKDGFLNRRHSASIMPIAFLALCVVWFGVVIMEQCGK